MRKYLLLLLICTQQVFAQDIGADYQSFRKSLLDNYQSYRTDVLQNYAKYLEGVWDEYQVFRGVKRDETPKPIVVPVVDNTPSDDNTPTILPTPDNVPDEPVQTPRPEPVVPIAPALPKSVPILNFSFYGVNVKVAKITTHKVSSLESQTIASAWREYQKDCPNDVFDMLRTESVVLGLNDWFTYELVRSYADEILKSGSSSDRIVLQHFLLVNLGYDVRLGCTKNQMLLLTPVKQQMYERSYLKINETCYYVYLDNISPIEERTMSMYTYNLPQEANGGSAIDMTFYQRALNVVSEIDMERTISDGRLHVTCSVNSGMMEMLRRYPLIDVPYYAMSNVLPPFHQDILRQLRPQIEGMSQRQATNALLYFVQHAFEYATDGEQHGYEKPYFIEENFYYPKNDCEDRAIFFAFLVRNLIGLDVYLIEYPGHECTAVCFTDSSIHGDGFVYNNKTFLICDPTYINASIGQCMPDYRGVKPKIEKWY
jgi:hypothetical protein